MNLHDHGIGRRQLRQGGGRGSGNDHVDELFGATELFVHHEPYQTPKGFENLKLYLESQECEVIYTTDTLVDLGDCYQSFRVTRRRGDPIPEAVLKRAHSWAHQRNLLHSFFKPLYR
ncbi:MAG: hypothetical protein FJ316_09490 [SAR202 cluster bacterium]|nr:hypothetical protein [SAR202 cluster bacterium]